MTQHRAFLRRLGADPSKRRARSRGQSMVEFALILPIVLLIVAAVADFGFLLGARMSVINAAREGARAAMERDEGVTISSAVSTRVTEVMSDAEPGRTVGVTTQCQVDDHSVASANWAGCTTADKGDYVKVSVNTTHRTLFAFVFDMFDLFPPDGSRIPLSSSVQMILEK